MPRKKKEDSAPEVEPHVVWREDGFLEIYTPPRRDFNTLLKSCIYPGRVKFDDTIKAWVVDPDWTKVAMDLVHDRFGAVPEARL